MTEPAGLRATYLRGRLDDAAAPASWYPLMRDWFEQAVADERVLEPNAVALATADTDGVPAVRFVLAKSIDERGIVFYSNYASAKARDLDANPRAALVFVWLALGRQVRFAGPVRKVERAQTEAYFATRPRESQLGAWASPQSRVVDSRAELDALADEAARRFDDHPVPAPPGWGGYLLAPDAVEFWQGRRGRLHDRLRYRRAGGQSGWIRERLAP